MTVGMWIAAVGVVGLVVVVYCACVLAGRADGELERDAMARRDRERVGL